MNIITPFLLVCTGAALIAEETSTGLGLLEVADYPRESFISFSMETSRKALAKDITTVSVLVRKTMAANGIQASGKPTLLYTYHVDPQSPEGKEARFTIASQLPVDPATLEGVDLGPCEIVTKQPSRAVSVVYQGPMRNGLPHIPLRQYAQEKDLQRTLVEREIYKEWTGPNSDKNTVEIRCYIEAEPTNPQ